MREHEETESESVYDRGGFRQERNRFYDEGAGTRVERFWCGDDEGRESVRKREIGWGVCGHESRFGVGRGEWGLSCAARVRRSGKR